MNCPQDDWWTILSFAHFPHICSYVLVVITNDNWTLQWKFNIPFEVILIQESILQGNWSINSSIFQSVSAEISFTSSVSETFIGFNLRQSMGVRQGHRALCNKFLLYGPPSIPWPLGRTVPVIKSSWAIWIWYFPRWRSKQGLKAKTVCRVSPGHVLSHVSYHSNSMELMQMKS